MKETRLKFLILGGVFVLALIVTLLVTRSSSEEEISYTLLGDSTLPVIKISGGNCDINDLYGYTGKVNGSQMQETLTPIGKENKIKIKIYNTGEIITGISYEIRSIDGSNFISSNSLESWESGTPYLTAEIPIIDIIDDGVQYQLIIKLKTEKLGEISYYTRIVRNSETKITEILDYVTDLHAATLGMSDADKYAVNWEPDGSMDDGDLSCTGIHSGFRNLTYKNLKPVQVGESRIDLLELDNTLGAFRVISEIKAADADGGESSFRVTEYISVLWSPVRFYLMSYERNMTQIFEAKPETITAEGLKLGITSEKDVQIFTSEEGKCKAFVNDGNLWTYSPETEEINEIFSFVTGQELLYRLHQDYSIRVVSVSDDGNVSFIVQGYMARGIHEGECGLSFFTYVRETNKLTEIIYMPSQEAPQIADLSLDTLCKKVGTLTYILYNNTVFAIDENASEIIRMVENAALHNFTVNDSQLAMAWSQGADLNYPTQVQVKYTDTGLAASYDAEEGEYVLPKGFVDNDIVIAAGRKEDEGTDGVRSIRPMRRVIIMDETGKGVSDYVRAGIYIYDAEAAPGKIIISRMNQENGRYRFVEDDTLMQNDMEYKKAESPLTMTNDDIKGLVRTLPFKSEKKSVSYSAITPGKISYFEGQITSSEPDDTPYFYAYAEGKLQGRYEQASEAINAVYDRFGSVMDKDGFRIWHRAPKTTGRVQINIPENPEKVSENNVLAGCAAAMLAKAGIVVQAETLLQDADVLSTIGEKAPGPVVLLDGCTIRQISYFIDRICPVLIVDGEGTPYLMTGYDEANIYYFDPVTGKTQSMSASALSALLESRNTRVISYLNK